MTSSSSSSQSLSASSFSSRSWNHDVFLSFKENDTHKTFVDRLYTALEQEGIYTYRYSEILPRGELIGPSLKKAIKESQMVIVIFSKNYVDSSWCLDELEYIMKCKDTRGQIVLPVFYDVDPLKCENKNKNMEKHLPNMSWRTRTNMSLGEKHLCMQVMFLDGKPSTSPTGMNQRA